MIQRGGDSLWLPTDLTCTVTTLFQQVWPRLIASSSPPTCVKLHTTTPSSPMPSSPELSEHSVRKTSLAEADMTPLQGGTHLVGSVSEMMLAGAAPRHRGGGVGRGRFGGRRRSPTPRCRRFMSVACDGAKPSSTTKLSGPSYWPEYGPRASAETDGAGKLPPLLK